MAIKKAQNSVLLLTTLGVYIGLLVAGGTAPQVLAHSATTRNFEITDEIEIKDDLDKKPDSVSDPCIYDSEFSVEENLARFYAVSVLRAFDETADHSVESLEKRILSWNDNNFNQGHSSVFGAVCDGFQSSIRAATLAEGEFDLSFRITSKRFADPSALATFLQSGFESERWRKDPSRTGHLLRHTSQFIENDQLYVVTRLPRGSLDPLLVKSAK